LDEILGFFFFCHEKYLGRAVTEERSREMKRVTPWRAHELLQVPRYFCCLYGKVLRRAQT
jgi:hypothetical protein